MSDTDIDVPATSLVVAEFAPAQSELAAVASAVGVSEGALSVVQKSGVDAPLFTLAMLQGLNVPDSVRYALTAHRMPGAGRIKADWKSVYVRARQHPRTVRFEPLAVGADYVCICLELRDPAFSGHFVLRLTNLALECPCGVCGPLDPVWVPPADWTRRKDNWRNFPTIMLQARGVNLLVSLYLPECAF